MKIKCILGYHKWELRKNGLERTCSRCGRHEHERFSFTTSGPVWDIINLYGGKEE